MPYVLNPSSPEPPPPRCAALHCAASHTRKGYWARTTRGGYKSTTAVGGRAAHIMSGNRTGTALLRKVPSTTASTEAAKGASSQWRVPHVLHLRGLLGQHDTQSGPGRAPCTLLHVHTPPILQMNAAETSKTPSDFQISTTQGQAQPPQYGFARGHANHTGSW